MFYLPSIFLCEPWRRPTVVNPNLPQWLTKRSFFLGLIMFMSNGLLCKLCMFWRAMALTFHGHFSRNNINIWIKKTLYILSFFTFNGVLFFFGTVLKVTKDKFNFKGKICWNNIFFLNNRLFIPRTLCYFEKVFIFDGMFFFRLAIFKFQQMSDACIDLQCMIR